jgi:hypothetical protein
VRVNSKRVSIGNNPIQWGRCILAIYPYNTDMYTTEYNKFFENEKLNRVYSWNEFYEMIKEEM